MGENLKNRTKTSDDSSEVSAQTLVGLYLILFERLDDRTRKWLSSQPVPLKQPWKSCIHEARQTGRLSNWALEAEATDAAIAWLRRNDRLARRLTAWCGSPVVDDIVGEPTPEVAVESVLPTRPENWADAVEWIVGGRQPTDDELERVAKRGSR